jgi:hypothetical protein
MDVYCILVGTEYMYGLCSRSLAISWRIAAFCLPHNIVGRIRPRFEPQSRHAKTRSLGAGSVPLLVGSFHVWPTTYQPG